MKRIILLFTICICILSSALPTFPSDASTEAELAAMSRLAENLMVMGDIHGLKGKSLEEKEKIFFGRAFLSDLKAKKGIEIISPVVVTDDYNDPKLQAYISKCPKLELNLSVDPGGWGGRFPEMWNELSYEEKKKSGQVLIWKEDFRLYEVESNKGKLFSLHVTGGYETYQHKDPIIYQKQKLKEAKNPPKPSRMGVNYRIFDMDACRDYDGIAVTGDWDDRNNKPSFCSNGILKYKDKYYVYGMCDNPADPVHGRVLSLFELTVDEGKKDALYRYRYEFHGFWSKDFLMKKEGK